MRYVIYFLLVFSAIGCKNTKNNGVTYFGGQIINPKTNYVLFLKDEKVIDTLLLDENNRFLMSFPSLKEGFYRFMHGVEFQYIYLEPSDSVLVRLNTWDFDHSLVFNGKGSAKNEFLLNLFLQNEKEERMMYAHFDLNEKDFQTKIDSLSKERVAVYKEFLTNEGAVSKGFEKFINVAIQFPLYQLKEIYPYYHKDINNLGRYPEVSKAFYDFRKTISLNEENLVSFYPYQNYVVSYLYNISFRLKDNDSTKNDITVNILNAVNEHIKASAFKNLLLKRIVVGDFLKSESTCRINEEALSIFLENCTNKDYVEKVKNLVKDCNYISQEEALHNFEIISYNNIPITINEIIKNKNTVIYFWSLDYMSSEYLAKRIKFLEEKYPNLLFVGINMQDAPQDLSKESNLKSLDIDNQYKLSKDSYAHNYLNSKLPRIILVDEGGIVRNGFTNLDSRNLDSELNKLK